MRKRMLCVILALMMLLSLATGVFAAQQELSVVIDGETVAFTADSGVPFVDENGRTQVPLRAVMEQYGCSVTWDAANQAAVLTKDGTTVVVPVGKSYITVNGARVATDTAAQVKNGRTYLPIRAVLEAFGAEVIWESGKVGVTSGASASGAGFENIYVDKDGNLIFELSNGTKINAGQVGKSGKNGRDGDDGRDGVSVTDAYVDASGSLMIALSSGRVINAGNVGAGRSMSGLTFADYPVGTKFYLTQPTGTFNVTVKVGGTSYTVKFESVYYELTGKYSASDAKAWVYADGKTTYKPYDVTMHIKGSTDAALAGMDLTVVFDSMDSNSWSYTTTVETDGSFSVTMTQGENGTTPWNEPKTLMLRSIAIEKQFNPWWDVPDDSSADDIQAALAKIVGTWEIPGEPENTFTVQEDGKIQIGSETYTPEYDGGESYLSANISDNARIRFDFDEGNVTVRGNGLSISPGYDYYKSGSYDAVTFTKDNFFTYYEYQEKLSVSCDAFGGFTGARLCYNYELKDEYESKLIYKNSTAAAKVSFDWYKCSYTIDPAKQTITIEEPGTYDSDGTWTSGTGLETVQLGYVSIYDDAAGTENFAKNIKLTDVTGTLYLLKD